jgi:hypothetical protein
MFGDSPYAQVVGDLPDTWSPKFNADIAEQKLLRGLRKDFLREGLKLVQVRFDPPGEFEIRLEASMGAFDVPVEARNSDALFDVWADNCSDLVHEKVDSILEERLQNSWNVAWKNTEVFGVSFWMRV